MNTKQVYFDNAATTRLDDEVLEAMLPFMKEHYGNPSATHAFGRKTRSAIEMSRRGIAQFLNVTPGEIVFTSGGTEADNFAITSAITCLGCTRIITSAIEHHAVLHTAEIACDKNNIELQLVNLDEKGSVDLNHLRELLASSDKKTLVSLMHANNEVGNMISLKRVGKICRDNGAYFHSDTVQTMAHYNFNLAEIEVDFITCAGHKFHGPKGVGFLYINKELNINPMIYGGAQERNMRGGTENLYGIIGLGKAIEVAARDMEEHQNHVKGLKKYMVEKLTTEIPGVQFNGTSAEESSLYTVLSVCFPETDKADMLRFLLDLEGIAVSAGSACSSGSDKGSHVLTGIGAPSNRPTLRFSFSKYNTKEEVDYVMTKLKELFVLQEV